MSTAASALTAGTRLPSSMVTALLAACLAIPWVLPFAPGPSANVVPWLVAAACTLAWYGALPSTAPSRGLLLALAAVVLFVALRPGGSLDRLAFAGACALVLLAMQAARGAGAAAQERTSTAAIAGAWLGAALVSSLIALLQYFDAAAPLQPWVHGAGAGEALANLRQRNQFASLTGIGLAALLWFAGGGRARMALLLAAVVLLAAANAATTSRTGALQWLAVLALTVLWRDDQRGRRLLLCLAGLAAYALAGWLLPLALEQRTGLDAASLATRLATDLGCSSRSVLWRNVLSLVGQRPILGWGWGELDYAHFIHLYGEAPRFCDILDNAHNLPLHIAVELGVPAAILFCGLAAWGLWRGRPWAESDRDRQLAWLVLAVLALHSLLEYPLWYGPFQLALGLALGLLLRGRGRSMRAALPLATRGVVAGCGLALLAYAGWDYARVSQVYLEPEARYAAWRENTLDHVRRSWLFAGQARFAEVTLVPLSRDNAEWMDAASQSLLHYSPEPRVIERVIASATMQERYDDAVLHLARYRAAFPSDYAKWRAAQQRPPP